MFYRSKFVTNSSSTSIIAFGISVSRDVFNEIEDDLPEGVDYRHTPYDEVYVYIGFPDIDIESDGLLVFPPPDILQKEYLALQEWIDKHRDKIKDTIGYIEDSWYNG